jgi:hypothetical protein
MPGMNWADIPYQHVLRRYGIDETAWNEVRRTVQMYKLGDNAEVLRPGDILNTKLANNLELYHKFYHFVMEESKYMVPGATLEAQVTLRSSLRPDTLAGAIMHSFSMYKNFPITFVNMYSRMAMSQERTMSKIGFAGAIIASTYLTGVLGTQMREISKGREPLPFDRLAFHGKAMLAGGGLSILGDFLFAGMNDRNQGLGETIAGPVVSFANSLRTVAFGDPYKYVQMYDQSENDIKSSFKSNIVQFAKMYTPGTSLWYTRLLLEREVWDVLEELADPQAYRKRQQRVQRQRKDFGNEYWSVPGRGITGEGPMLLR